MTEEQVSVLNELEIELLLKSCDRSEFALLLMGALLVNFLLFEILIQSQSSSMTWGPLILDLFLAVGGNLYTFHSVSEIQEERQLLKKRQRELSQNQDSL